MLFHQSLISNLIWCPKLCFKLFVLLKVKKVTPQFQMESSTCKQSNNFSSFHCLINFQTAVLRLEASGFMIWLWISGYKTVFLEAVKPNSFLKPLFIKLGNMMLSTASKKLAAFSWLGGTDLCKEWNGLVQSVIIQGTELKRFLHSCKVLHLKINLNIS